jgi:putative phosphoribosyl transferase
MPFRFLNRSQAGQCLAHNLQNYAGQPEVIVLALPRGGVPVAFEVAERLGVAWDVFLVRKLGVPFHEELALGAIASGGICWLNEAVIQSWHISRQVIERVINQERQELRRREGDYHCGGRPLDLRGRVVILIDDGLATGASMRAAVMAVKQQLPARVVVAVPVGAWDTVQELKNHVDEVVCVQAPEEFCAVGEWYEDFSQTPDEEVRDLLSRAARSAPNIAADTSFP